MDADKGDVTWKKQYLCREKQQEALKKKRSETELHSVHFKPKTRRWWWVWEGARFLFAGNGHCVRLIMHPKHGKTKHTALRHTDRGALAPGSGTNLTHTRQTPTVPRHRTKAADTPASPSAAPGLATARGPALTWPQTAPGPGHLSVPAAGTASRPSSACPGLGARRQQGRLPPEWQRRAAPAAPAPRRLRCCSADGNSCSHQWQHTHEHFGSFSALNSCQFPWWAVAWFCRFFVVWVFFFFFLSRWTVFIN